MPQSNHSFPALFLIIWLTFGGPILFWSQAGWAFSHAISLEDSLGRLVLFEAPPKRVVCLLSSVTDLLDALDRTELLVGLTRQDLLNHPWLRLTSMGSFFQPDLAAIEAARPDLIIASTSQQTLLRQWIDNPQSPTKILPHGHDRPYG